MRHHFRAWRSNPPEYLPLSCDEFTRSGTPSADRFSNSRQPYETSGFSLTGFLKISHAARLFVKGRAVAAPATFLHVHCRYSSPRPDFCSRLCLPFGPFWLMGPGSAGAVRPTPLFRKYLFPLAPEKTNLCLCLFYPFWPGPEFRPASLGDQVLFFVQSHFKFPVFFLSPFFYFVDGPL